MWNYRVDLEFPKIEVRFKNLTVESFVHVGSRALPTIPNFVFNMAEVEFYSFYNHFFLRVQVHPMVIVSCYGSDYVFKFALF